MNFYFLDLISACKENKRSKFLSGDDFTLPFERKKIYEEQGIRKDRRFQEFAIYFNYPQFYFVVWKYFVFWFRKTV
jgi:hypothetical protein